MRHLDPSHPCLIGGHLLLKSSRSHETRDNRKGDLDTREAKLREDIKAKIS